MPLKRAVNRPCPGNAMRPHRRARRLVGNLTVTLGRLRPRAMKHWNPDDALIEAIEAEVRREQRRTRPKPHWPHGATAGIALVAAGCIGLALVLYHVAGPRDVFVP